MIPMGAEAAIRETELVIEHLKGYHEWFHPLSCPFCHQGGGVKP